jgi:hypothetical protein
LQKNFLLFQRNFSDKALIPFIGVSQKQNLMGRRMKRVIRKSEDLPERAAVLLNLRHHYRRGLSVIE